MSRLYNSDYDFHILDILQENEKLWFRQIKKNLEFRINRRLSFETYAYHIKKLRENHYIEPICGNIKRGQRLFYRLTDWVRQELRTGILQMNLDKISGFQRVETLRERLIQIYHTVFFIVAVKPPPLIYDEDFYLYSGVTLDDLSRQYSSMLGYNYVKLSKKVIRTTLRYLENEGLIVRIRNNENEKERYAPNGRYESLILDCTEIFNCSVFLRYAYLWRGIRAPRLTERPIFEMMFNKNDVNQQILHFKKVLRENKQSLEYKKLYKKNKECVDDIDNAIYESYNDIVNKYPDLLEKFPTLTNHILNMYFPQFLLQEIKNIHYKYPDKKYHKQIRVSFNDGVIVSNNTSVRKIKKQDLF